MEEFTKLMIAALADSITKKQRDSNGYEIQSPFDNFLYRWIEANKVEILEAMSKKINMDETARKIAENVTKEIERFGGSMSYDTERFKGKLDALVMEKLAARIASTIELPKSN